MFVCIFFPLFGSIIVAVFGSALGKRGAQFVTCTAVTISALISCFILNSVIAEGVSHDIKLFDWIESGDLLVSWGIYIDTLSAIMIFVVASVSALVRVYSVGCLHSRPWVE